MPSNSTKYAVDVLLDPENLPSEDKSVIWDESSGSFAIGDAPSSGGGSSFNSGYIYQVHDGVTITRTFETGDPDATPSTGTFRMQPDGLSNSNRNANYFDGTANNMVNVQCTEGDDVANYLQRGGEDAQIAGFIYGVEECRHFFAFRGESETTLGAIDQPGRLDSLLYLDYQYSPYEQPFFPTELTEASQKDRWVQRNEECRFIVMAPQLEGEQDGMIYRAGPAANAFKNEQEWLILTTKPSGSSSEISEYLTAFEGGRLIFTNIEDETDYIVYKFDESFEFQADFIDVGVPDTNYVAFAGLKILIDRISNQTASTKYYVTVESAFNKRVPGFENENNNNLYESATLTRRFFMQNKGDTSYFGRRYEWGNTGGADPYGSVDQDTIIGGKFWITGFPNSSTYSEINFQYDGIWSVDDDYGLSYTGEYGPGYGHIIARPNIDQSTFSVFSTNGPALPIFRESNSGANVIPDTECTLIIRYNFVKKTTVGAT